MTVMTKETLVEREINQRETSQGTTVREREYGPALVHDGHFALGVAEGGSVIEVLAGIAAIALGCLGLAGIVSTTLAAIAAIVVGATLLVQGTSLMAGFEPLSAGKARTSDLAGGDLSIEVAGGMAAAVLGILALAHVHPMALLAVAVLAIGGTTLIGTGALAPLTSRGWSGLTGTVATVLMLLGIAAGVLGIIAIASASHALTLVLVGWLVAGFAMLVSGTVLGTQVRRLLRR